MVKEKKYLGFKVEKKSTAVDWYSTLLPNILNSDDVNVDVLIRKEYSKYKVYFVPEEKSVRVYDFKLFKIPIKFTPEKEDSCFSIARNTLSELGSLVDTMLLQLNGKHIIHYDDASKRDFEAPYMPHSYHK